MKILARKYNYDSSVETNEVNYFSPTAETTRDELDLYPYLMAGGLSEITSVKTLIDETNTVYIEAGDVTLNLTNTLTGWGDVYSYTSLAEISLTDFFEYYNDNKSIFHIRIYDNNDNNFFEGVIRKTDLTFEDRTNEVIQIIVKSLDKEFANYYSTQVIINRDTMYTFTRSDLNFTNLQFIFLAECLVKNFPKVTFNFAPDITNFVWSYIMATKPYIYSPCNVLSLGNANTLILKTGYDSYVNDRANRYEFFSSVVQSMGWKWEFKQGVLYVEKRADLNQPEYNINYADILFHSVDKNEIQNISSVIIDNGSWAGLYTQDRFDESTIMHILDTDDGLYYYLGGASKAVYSKSELYSNNINPFRGLVVAGTVFNSVYTRNFSNWGFTTERDSADQFLKLRYFFLLNTGTYSYQYQTYNYDLNQTIHFKPLIPSEESSSVLDTGNVRPLLLGATGYGNGNHYKNINGIFEGNASSIYYNGNAGSSMLRVVSGASNPYIPYDAYIKSSEFENNLKTLTTEEGSISMNVTISGVLTSLDYIFKFPDYPYADFSNKKFICKESSIDLLNQTTTLKVIAINESEADSGI